MWCPPFSLEALETIDIYFFILIHERGVIKYIVANEKDGAICDKKRTYQFENVPLIRMPKNNTNLRNIHE